MQELHEIYGPEITKWLAPMNQETRDILLPAMEQALNSIELACPVAMGMTRGGFVSAYGPAGLRKREMMAVLATPECAVRVAFDNLPPYHKPPKEFAAAEYWKVIYDLIVAEDTARALAVVALRMGAEGCKSTRKIVTQFRADGMTPALLVLVGVIETRAAGCIGILPLPPRIEAQLEEH